MANIDKELNDIKNAVYGREVRGAIHDGIDKINKESEDSREKATEAHDVMTSIMTEGFDNAALEANFEQRLNDEIANLQPEWTGFKEDVTTQLAETDEQTRRNMKDIMPGSRKMFKKKIVLNLPGRFPDYEDVMQGFSGYMHVQAFCILKKDNLIFLYYVPEGDLSNTNRWVAVYEWDTGDYISCFGLVSEGWEGIVVKYEDDKRYLYVGGKNPVMDYDLHKYDITILPDNKSILNNYETISLSIGFRFGYNNGNWIVMKERDIDNENIDNRSFWQILDDEFNVIKDIRVDGRMMSLTNKGNIEHFPKLQGLSIGSDYIVVGVGADAPDGKTGGKYQQGILILDSDGNIKDEGMMNSQIMLNELQLQGYNAEKVENEGVVVDENNDIYSLWVLNTTDNKKGIVVFKEGIRDRNSLDFSNASESLYALDLDKYSNRLFPVIDKKIINPLTGNKFNNIKEMLNFASDYRLPSIKVYVTSSTDLKGFNNEDVQSTFYNFHNLTTYTFIGTETSPSGKKEILYNRNTGNVRYIGTNNEISLVDSQVNVTLNEEIPLIENINNFKEVKFIFQASGFPNKIHSYVTSYPRYDIRDFNMVDSSAETIIFYEITLDVIDSGNKLKITKCNRQIYDGITSVNKEIGAVGTQQIIDIIGVF